ncbi:MAG: universal stress protein [Terricaulis sp.]
MAYKDILAPVFKLSDDEAALVAAGEIARMFDARATALIVAVQLASDYSDAPHTLSEVLADIAAGSRSEAARERAKVLAWIEGTPHDFEVRDVCVEGAVEQGDAEAHARVADIVICAQAVGVKRARRMFIERVLFKAGRPILLVPAAPVEERRWKRLLIGWNGKAEAMRAVSAAMPLLKQAEHVFVVTVDARPSGPEHLGSPGRDLAEHLSRHDISVELRNVDGLGRATHSVLVDEAFAVGVDAIVLGAYSRPRAQEMLFGGVTHALLGETPLPLLLCH